mgnify:CR=1 FL=1
MKRIRNSIQCVAYIMLIMLLLLGSLPLSGVFAEVTNTQERTLINETNILENKQVEESEAEGSEVIETTESIFTQELEVIEDMTAVV